MHLLHCQLIGFFILITHNWVEGLMWNNPVRTFGPDYTYNSGRKFSNAQHWNFNSEYTPWQVNPGWYQTGWQYPPGNIKGNNNRRCFDSRHCNRGECCQYLGYSNTGLCVYGQYSSSFGCNEHRPREPVWIQRPINPGNNKGDGSHLSGYVRPGSCPPQKLNSIPQQQCLRDENCPYNQKCCFRPGICAHPIFA